MSENRFVMICTVLTVLVGFVGGARSREPDTGPEVPEGRIVAVDTEGIRHYRPADWFRHETFADTANIAAETLLRNSGHQMMLVQIRDREQFHYHRNHDLVVFLLEGQGELRLGDRRVSVSAGDWLVIPREVRHQFVNQAEHPSRALVLRTPAPPDRDYVPASR